MAINQVTIVGNLTRDAEVREIRPNLPVANFCVAVNDRKRGANEEWVDDTVFVRCTLFGSRAKKLHLTKGTKVMVAGKLHYSAYMKDDEQRSELSVTVNQIELFTPAPKQDAPATNYYNY